MIGVVPKQPASYIPPIPETLVIEGRISQVSTDAPTATIYKNDTNYNLSYSRIGFGVFEVMITGTPDFKGLDAVIEIGQTRDGRKFNAYRTAGLDRFRITTDGSDGYLDNTLFRITIKN